MVFFKAGFTIIATSKSLDSEVNKQIEKDSYKALNINE